MAFCRVRSVERTWAVSAEVSSRPLSAWTTATGSPVICRMTLTVASGRIPLSGVFTTTGPSWMALKVAIRLSAGAADATGGMAIAAAVSAARPSTALLLMDKVCLPLDARSIPVRWVRGSETLPLRQSPWHRLVSDTQTLGLPNRSVESPHRTTFAWAVCQMMVCRGSAQETAFCTRARIRFSTDGVTATTAKETGQISPSSRSASSAKLRVG